MTSAWAGCNAGYCNFEIPQVAQGEGGGGGGYRIVKRKKWPEKVGRREISGRKCREEGNLPSCTSPLSKDDRTDTNFIAPFKMHF